MTTSPIKDKYSFYVSSWHKKKNPNYVGIVEQEVTEYEDGSTTSELKIKKYEDPIRPFYVTSPAYRNHEYKKEFEKISHCDKYLAKDSEVQRKVAKALGYSDSYINNYVNLRKLYNSPYVYVADIPTETILRQEYIKKARRGKMVELTRGGLDIETEVRGEERIIAITFISEHQVYTSVLREYCKYYPNGTEGASVNATKQDCLKRIDELIGTYLQQHEFNLHLHIADNELDIIKWIFDRIHEEKTMYIGIWNMSFDIPKILSRIEALHGDAEEIMCHPDIPKKYRYVSWYLDKSNTDHYTDKWHWLSVAGYSQFVDAMCLYARLRKTSGRESSYSLDAISNKELGTGKLHFGNIMNHWYAQNYQFLDYIAYNINDVLIMEVMEWKNNDMTSMLTLSGVSLPRDFSRQTVMLRNDAYMYGEANGRVPAATGETMLTKYDIMQPKAGGTVLPPNKTVNAGAKLIQENPDINTQVFLFCNDLDFSSMYPNAESAINVSKESYLSTCINILGRPYGDIEKFYMGVVRPVCHAYDALNTIYQMPSYTEMLEMFEQEMLQK